MLPVSNLAAAAPTNANSQLPNAKPLSSSDFVRILVAEFRNQDPTRPVDPTQFATQLVQFSNLGQLEGIRKAVQTTPSGGLMQAASAFIGREVVAAGNSIGLDGGKATSIVFAPVAAGDYTAEVFDAEGQPVDEVSLGQLEAGSLETFSWEPPGSAADGRYTVKILNGNGTEVGGLLEQGVVDSVSLSSVGVVLDLGNLLLTQDQVITVSQP